MDATHAAPTEPWQTGGTSTHSPLADLRPRRPAPRLHRPVRGVIAVVELILVAALGFAVYWAWQRVRVPYELPAVSNPAVPRIVHRWSGPWVGAAFGLVTLAGVLALDALRQVVLAVRTGDRSRASAGHDEQREPDQFDR